METINIIRNAVIAVLLCFSLTTAYKGITAEKQPAKPEQAEKEMPKENTKTSAYETGKH